MKHILAAAARMMAVPANAAFHAVTLAGVSNGDWASQDFYTIPAGFAVLGAAPFLIADAGNGARYWTAAGQTGTVMLTMPVSIFGATHGFTLMNTFWGVAGGGFQSVTFNATGGVSATFVLVGDDDVRDYLNNDYTNAINGTSTIETFTKGSRHLDRQLFVLPTSFATQTLTLVVFTDTGADGVSRMTLTGLTIHSVPEPQSWALMIAGFGLVGAMARRRRRFAV